jgi:hypothetical protein
VSAAGRALGATWRNDALVERVAAVAASRPGRRATYEDFDAEAAALGLDAVEAERAAARCFDVFRLAAETDGRRLTGDEFGALARGLAAGDAGARARAASTAMYFELK